MSSVSPERIEDLERMRRFGAFEERERIIGMLETSELRWLNTFVATKEITARESFIALIKGENK